MTREWKLISTADEALEAILALSKAERARLFDLMAREPALARYMMPPSPKQLGFDLSADFEGAPDYVIIFDGGSEGNPGFGYGSYAVITRDGRLSLASRYAETPAWCCARYAVIGKRRMSACAAGAT
jgi:hypothetical protein